MKEEGYFYELMCQEFKDSRSTRFIQKDRFKGFKVNANKTAQDGSVTNIHYNWMLDYLRMFQWFYHREKETLAFNLRLGVMPAPMQAELEDDAVLFDVKDLLRLVLDEVARNVKGFDYAYCGCIERDDLSNDEHAAVHMHAGLLTHGLRNAQAIKAAFHKVRSSHKKFKDAYLVTVPFDFSFRTRRQEDKNYFLEKGLDIKGAPAALVLDSDTRYEYAIFCFSYHCKQMTKESLIKEGRRILSKSKPRDFLKGLPTAKKKRIEQVRKKIRRIDAAANDAQIKLTA